MSLYNYLSLDQDQRVTDLVYSQFYYQVVKRLIDFDDARSLRGLKLYFQISRPQRCYGNEVRDSGFVNNQDDKVRLLMTTLFYRAIQVFRSGPIMSSAVDFHIRNLFMKNKYRLTEILRNGTVRICSIGGRLPSDLVAVVSVLESAAKERSVNLDMHVTVIETDCEWKTTCLAIMDCLEYFRDHPWRVEFITQDIMHLGYGRAGAALRKADIVTLTKFYTEFNDTPGNLSDALKEIGTVMRPESLLFQLDFSKDNVIKFFGGPLGTLENFRVVYDELCDLHALDPDAVENSYRLYQNTIAKPYYSKFLNVFARAWVKTAGKKKVAYQYGSKSNYNEKYNPKQTFLSAKCIESWERKVREEAEIRKFSRLGTKKRIDNEKTERNLMLNNLLKERKKLQIIEHELAQVTVEEDGSENDNNEWNKYLSQKRNFSAYKLKIYSYSLNLIARRLERDAGFVKKKTHGPRSVPLPITAPGYSKMRFPD